MPRNRRLGMALWMALWMACLSGCASWPQAKPPLDASAGLFDSATLVYRLDASRLGVPLAVARVEGQRVAYEELASGPRPGESTGTLQLTYPHPSGRANLAQAKVIIESGAAATDDATPWFLNRALAQPQSVAREVWVLDITRNELGALVQTLQNVGFFQEGAFKGGVEITAQLNLTKIKKDWQPVPQLDELMRRVRSQGQLVSYSRGQADRPLPAVPTGVEVAERNAAGTAVTR